MSLDDLPTRSPQPQGNEAEVTVRRVDRPASPQDKVTRAERALSDFEDEARQKNIPPGWTRER